MSQGLISKFFKPKGSSAQPKAKAKPARAAASAADAGAGASDVDRATPSKKRKLVKGLSPADGPQQDDGQGSAMTKGRSSPLFKGRKSDAGGGGAHRGPPRLRRLQKLGAPGACHARRAVAARGEAAAAAGPVGNNQVTVTSRNNYVTTT